MDFGEILEKKERDAHEKAGKAAWLCSYTPVEIISSCGLLPFRIFASQRPIYGSSLLHTTLCSYARGALDEVLKEGEGGLEGAVLVNSCNAMFHLYHVLDNYGNLPFCYLLDLPRDNSRQAIFYFAGSLQRFHLALSAHCGMRAREDDLWEQIYLYAENRRQIARLYLDNAVQNFPGGVELIRLVRASMTLSAQDFRLLLPDYCRRNRQEESLNFPLTAPRIFLTGSMAPFHLIKLIHDLGGRLVWDDLCSGRRAVDFGEKPARGENPYRYLARLYLKRAPCARMKHALEHVLSLNKILQTYKMEGIIFFYLKFCDPWYYYGQLLKEKLAQIPVLVLEIEHMEPGITGQQGTRVAAFLEMLSGSREVC